MNAVLNEFGPSLWVASGPVLPFLGFPYPTRMAVIRLTDGSLFVWSPVALSPTLAQAVDALGPVHHLVSPNLLHHLFLAEWKSAYPAAILHAPPGLRRRKPHISFDTDLTATANPAWATDIDQVPMRGNPVLTEIVFFHRASQTVLFADLVQNFPPTWFKGWRGWLARLDGIVAPHPGAPRDLRALFLNRRAARAALNTILAWPIARVLMAHGTPVSTDGAAFVRAAFAWLKP